MYGFEGEVGLEMTLSTLTTHLDWLVGMGFRRFKPFLLPCISDCGRYPGY